MAKEAPAAEEKPQEKPAKSLPIKTIGVVSVMLVLEAVVIIGAVKFFGQPSEVKGVGLEHAQVDVGETLVEIPLLHEKFTNNSSGRMWIWDAEIIIKSKLKHAGPPEVEGAKADDGHGDSKDKAGGGHGATTLNVRQEMKGRMAEIRTGIASIMASGQHAYFTEPGRETLSRQIQEYLRRVFGHDAEGHERIVEVLIPRCLGMPADF